MTLLENISRRQFLVDCVKVFYLADGLDLIVKAEEPKKICGKEGIMGIPTNNGDVDWVESRGWIVTSYGDVNEALYNGNKIKIFDRNGIFLGLYRQDFLVHVIINGAGIGDGIGNDKTKFLHYDYDINDGKTCYLSDVSLGAYNNELVPWTGDRPSIAVNPALPQGTMIRFKDLGSGGNLNYTWVQDLLLSKTFYADDKFHGIDEKEKRIDVYVGLIERADNMGPQSLYIEDVRIMIESNPDLNNDGVVDHSDIKIFFDNWLRLGGLGKNPGDFNFDGKTDFREYALIAKKWMRK